MLHLVHRQRHRKALSAGGARLESGLPTAWGEHAWQAFWLSTTIARCCA